MSNIYPSNEMRVPPREEERPVRHLHSVVFTHEAWHCRPEHLWPKNYKEFKPEELDVVVRYLAAFTEPVRTVANELICFVCGSQITGHNVLLKDYRYKKNIEFTREGTWEGRCTECGYPCRLKHDIFIPNGGPRIIGLTGFPLFYHPTATQQTT
jgi:hypothetical protein